LIGPDLEYGVRKLKSFRGRAHDSGDEVIHGGLIIGP
jgi:hypothetical protein